MKPLAAELRPDSLDTYIGQTHLVGEGKPLRVALEMGHVFSFILWGPPGVGKTTLAKIVARKLNRDLYELSAVSAGKKDIAAIVEESKGQKGLGQSYEPPILFLDEIHRFNKAQQDYLLPFVESGDIVLIGATTENPSFEVNPALLSRLKVFVLEQLSEADLRLLMDRVLQYYQKQNLKLKLNAETIEWLTQYANGDGRNLLTVIEHTVSLYESLDVEKLKETVQSKFLSYDKKGEEHYNTISAFIKSMRASNVDAALYYLARMVAAGEDPKFIARRMVIFASEDVGVAAPTALVVANAVFQAVQNIGYPEAQINLAHGVTYLANCTKDRSAYDAYFAALKDVEQHGNLPIPLSLRNAPTKLMKNLGYGKNYEAYPEKDTSLLPDKIKNRKYFSK